METIDTTPPSSTSDHMPSRSRTRADRARRRTRRRVGLGAVIVAVGVVVGAAAAFALRDEPEGTRGATPSATAAPGVESAVAEKPRRRALTVDAPLRLWIGGDSLAGSLGPSLGETAAATGVVAPRFDSRISSGLMSPEFFDWPEHAAEEMARRDPEAVVFIIDTNDAQVMPDLASASPPSDVSASGGTDWRTEYTAKVEEMMQILIGDAHRPVYWVATPPMADDDLDDNVEILNGVIAEVAARHPEVTFIDVSDQFTDEDGEFTTTVTDDTGDTIRLRAGDGVHLTPEGGDRMAAPVFAAIDAAWRISAQAVPGHVQPIVQTEGSSQIPGTGRTVTGSSGSSGSSGTSSSGSGGSETTSTTAAAEEAPVDTTLSTEVTTPPPTDPTTPTPTDPTTPSTPTDDETG